MITHADPKWDPVTHWAAIVGTWNLEEESARFESLESPLLGGHGVALCDEKFRDGIIRASIRFEGGDVSMRGESAGVVLGYHPESGRYVVVGLGWLDSAYAIWEFVPGEAFHARRTVGTIQNLRYRQDYSVEIMQRGQRIGLVVDRVPVIEHVLPSPLTGNQLGLYAMSKSPVVFRDFQVQRRAPTVFVAMQFGEPYDTIYRTVIRPRAQRLGFDVIRIDEMNQAGIIFQDIQRRIEDAKVVIAEITAPNQNVYYEVGFAHALNKPTILLAQRGRDLPFDVRSYRVILYDDSIGGKPAVERTLGEHLQSILKEI